MTARLAPTAPVDRARPALLASDDVALRGFEAAHRQAAAHREIHMATCRPRRQGLGCSLCYRVAERLDQAEARLKRAQEAERRHTAAIATQRALDAGIAWG